MTITLRKKIAIYLVSLLSFSIFFLYLKHQIGNDSTISEWLINYEGGFTKRGIIGQIAIYFSRLFDQNLRWILFIMQVTACSIYFILIYNFLKDINYNRILILAIFTPIFVLYPVAEIEVLARKEILVFTLYLLYLLIPNNYFLKYFSFIIFYILSVLIWEPVVFFAPLFIAIEVIENKIESVNFKLIFILFKFLPGLLIAGYIAINPISGDNHEIMSSVLKKEFGETCYMSCALLKSKSTIFQQFQGNFHKYSLEIFIRYFLIILIGFGPIFILLKNSILKNKNLLFFNKFNNLLFPTILTLLPVILLFAMGYDWGRWVNISYVFTFIFYFYLLNKNYLIIENKMNSNFIMTLNKKLFIIIFVLFCFGWNPKTVITGDVASFPGYRIPYKTISYFIRGHF
tara:strand:+ start:378 stop:1580 length:1203 start_codon:yes stop_codon:yes gene_type:complete